MSRIAPHLALSLVVVLTLPAASKLAAAEAPALRTVRPVAAPIGALSPATVVPADHDAATPLGVAPTGGSTVTWLRLAVAGPAPDWLFPGGLAVTPDGRALEGVGLQDGGVIAAWRLDLERMRWEVFPLDRPIGPRWLGIVVMDPARARAILIGTRWSRPDQFESAEISFDGRACGHVRPWRPSFEVPLLGARAVLDPVRRSLLILGTYLDAGPNRLRFGLRTESLETRSAAAGAEAAIPGGGLPLRRCLLVPDPRGGRGIVLLSGGAGSNPSDGWEYALDGPIRWRHLDHAQDGPSWFSGAAAVMEPGCDEVWLVGADPSTRGGGSDVWRLHLDRVVGSRWERVVVVGDGAPVGGVSAACADPRGGCVLVFAHEATGKIGVWALVTGPGSAFAVVSDPAAATVPSLDVPPVPAPVFALEGAATEPARGPLEIAFTLPTRDATRLELFDVLGRRVAAREVGGLGPGRHVVRLDDERRVAAGVYYVRLRDPRHSTARRVTVLH